jgi:hypothetical protein
MAKESKPKGQGGIDNDACRQLAANVIDIVEAAIREAHPQVEEIASNWVDGEGGKPNTLLHGEAYYNLEDELAGKFRKALETAGAGEVEGDEPHGH